MAENKDQSPAQEVESSASSKAAAGGSSTRKNMTIIALLVLIGATYAYMYDQTYHKPERELAQMVSMRDEVAAERGAARQGERSDAGSSNAGNQARRGITFETVKRPPISETGEIAHNDWYAMGGSESDATEKIRLQRITTLVEEGTITQQQGYNIWNRLSCDKEAVGKLMQKAVAAGELTEDQLDRLMPLLKQEQEYNDTGRGIYGKNKQLEEGAFKAGEVSDQNLKAIYLRLDEANKRGEIYDFDVASIMTALYTGWNWQVHTAEEEYAMKVATAARWRILDSQGMMQKERRIENFRKKREDRQDDRADRTP